MKKRKTTCPDYTGVTCIDGTCPKANSEKYIEYGIQLPETCDECSHNLGCEDCYFNGNEENPCPGEKMNRYYKHPFETHFFLPMKKPPTVTHQEKKIAVVNGKPIVYEPMELKAARAKLCAMLAEHVPFKPYECGVQLQVKWMWFNQKVNRPTYKTTKPDTDNLQKLLKDCMTDVGFWKDDALVASEIVEKFTVPSNPGIWIQIKRLS